LTNLTLAQCFGANVVETSTTITILKSDLLGLMPSASNTADSIFAAIINTVHQPFEGGVTDQNGANLTDQNGINVTYDNHLYYTSAWVQFGGYYFPRNLLNTCFIYSQITPYEN